MLGFKSPTFLYDMIFLSSFSFMKKNQCMRQSCDLSRVINHSLSSGSGLTVHSVHIVPDTREVCVHCMHTSYLSQTPQTCLCKKIQSGVKFSRLNAKN